MEKEVSEAKINASLEDDGEETKVMMSLEGRPTEILKLCSEILATVIKKNAKEGRGMNILAAVLMQTMQSMEKERESVTEIDLSGLAGMKGFKDFDGGAGDE